MCSLMIYLEKRLRFFNKLHMTVYQVDFFEYVLLFDPINLNKQKNTIFLFLADP